MEQNWSDERRYALIAKVFITIIRARSVLGMIPVSVPDDLESTLRIDVDEIYRLEREIGHDIVALMHTVEPQLPEALRQFLGDETTSMDGQESAISLQLIGSLDLLITGVRGLNEVVKERAHEFKNTPMIGRSHGIHATPTTFGKKLLELWTALDRRERRLRCLREDLAVGKVSGTVGVYSLPPEVEEMTCRLLGLKPIVTSQIICRDLIAEYMTELAIIAGVIENFATDIRSLQRPEIGELEEPRGKKQRGSLGMPHKRNPIGCENLCGLARVVRSNSYASLETIATWDERDISNSSLERIVLPGSSELLDYMIARFTSIIRGLVVHQDRMLENIGLTKGMIYSPDVTSLLARSGVPRSEAHTMVWKVVMPCWERRGDFLEALRADPDIMQRVTESQLRQCFDLNHKLRYIDAIFDRVFGGNA